MNYRNLISALSLLGLLGCSTSQDDTLPNPQTSAEQVWQHQMSGGGDSADALSQTQGELRVPLDMTTLSQRESDYTRDSWRETTNLFPRLPNPDVVLYVLPHQSGALPVPGYSTVFPLYERVHYAAPQSSPANLPKERW